MTLAYLDSFAGLVPCKICAVGDWSDPTSLANIRYTATRGAYKRGEYDIQQLSNLIPRRAVYRSRQHCGQFRVRAYSWDHERNR